MKTTYYLSKTIATLPCLGLVPLGIYFMYLVHSAGLRVDLSMMALILAAMFVYISCMYHFASPRINPIDLQYAESSRKFVVVVSVITVIFSVITFIVGISFWSLLLMLFKWLANNLLHTDLSGQAEFFWIYFWASSSFQIVYLILWALADRSFLVRRLTKPNVCW